MPSTSLDLPMETSTASFLRYSGKSLAESATGKLEDFELSGVASSICMTSLRTSCSDITYILTKNFDSERVVQGEDEMRKFFVFQLCHHLFVPLWGTTRRHSLQRWLSWICLKGCKTRQWQPRFHRMVLKCW